MSFFLVLRTSYIVLCTSYIVLRTSYFVLRTSSFVLYIIPPIPPAGIAGAGCSSG